ncbi:hypothetical protein M885DRAFT_509729 [Pelagophyceae sp. CCMP2097]|nr:hypothetical protein M885DRAFT_509729 [Pelagophyceae sp. CCMP2097]
MRMLLVFGGASCLTARGALRRPSNRGETSRGAAVGAAAVPSGSDAGTLWVDDAFSGLTYARRNPDIILLKDFLNEADCERILERARAKTLSRSPVAYGGWTGDVAELTQLVASGPAAWAALLNVWAHQTEPRLELAFLAAATWLATTLLAAAGATLWARQREEALQALRTSSSVTLDYAGDDAVALRLQALLGANVARSRFEATTVIRYEPGQVLAPHYDATPNADVERPGGQTLLTLLVYLNDVDRGGTTRFGKLDPPLELVPKRGDACLFFPATARRPRPFLGNRRPSRGSSLE